MATQTPNLDLKKPAGTDYVRIGDFNANADKLDAAIGDPAQLETAEKTSLVLAINEAKNQGQYPPYIDDATKTWWAWNPATHQFEDSGEPARGEKGDPGVSVTVGTTTTGAAGTNASVTNSGTASDPILNFTIPRGDTGVGDMQKSTYDPNNKNDDAFSLANMTGDATHRTVTDEEKTAWNGKAAGSHAAQHAADGADPIKVGDAENKAVFTGSGGTLDTKSVSDAKIALDIDPRGFEYAGREIPFTWAQISAKIKAGDFTGLRVGDYKDIIINGTFYDAASNENKAYTNEMVRMEIGGINSYFQYGDVLVPRHIDFISRDCASRTLKYNATNTNSGGYVGSALFTTLNGPSGLVNLLPPDVAAVIITKRGFTEVKTGTDATGRAWNNMGLLWIPTEREVWGSPAWSEIKWGAGLSVQYSIFKYGLRHITKGGGHGLGRCDWWCASSMASSATEFCFVDIRGCQSRTTAIDEVLRVPLCFRVA